ncbi:hypothetical protein LXA43DRAFT_977623 [Ganoderma leucocontextum]|nr:hypothetical protein LXA43DRAFT_977623 [Ganoderma leucocontextum]
MAPRAYSMKQDSFFRPQEWEFLERVVLDVEVQEYVAKGEYNKARAILASRWHEEFKGPTGGESDEIYKRRLRFAKKTRKGHIARRRAETQEEWDARMRLLNNRLSKWLSNWRQKARRRGTKPWHPPVIGAPKARKPRKRTAFDAFCQSDEAPKGSDFKTADGLRCDLAGLNAARTAAWQSLCPDKQAEYLAIAQETFEDPASEEDSCSPSPEAGGHDASQGRVATAEAIVTYIDEFVQVMHHDVSWGGMVIFGGPDHTGEARIHAQTAGTNRHGQTFLDAMLQVIGWTQLDFDTVFSLWLEQCRQGPQDAEDRTFAEAARRAIQPNNAITRGTVMGTQLGSAFTVGPEHAAPDAAAVLEALNRLTLAIQPRTTPAPETPAALPPMATPFAEIPMENVASDPPLPDLVPASAATSYAPESQIPSPVCPALLPPPPVLARGTLFTHVDPLVASLAPPSVINYDIGCQFRNISFPEDPMDWQPDDQGFSQGVQNEGESRDVEHGTARAEGGPGHTSGGAEPVVASGRARQRKPTELSGVPMPGLRGVPVVERVLRPRNPRNREETMDG